MPWRAAARRLRCARHQPPPRAACPGSPPRPSAAAPPGPAPRRAAPQTPTSTTLNTPPSISVRGARQHNLKGLDLDLPLGRLTVVTGPSGSGKSSLAFHTLYAEGQRRYIETFSPYVRQFFDRMDKPAVDRIDGIPPAIAIEQKNAVRTTRSTVGTLTEINDYLKLLFARAARAFDPDTGEEIRPDTPASAATAILDHLAGRQILVTFPVPAPPNTTPAELFALLNQQGYLRVALRDAVLRTDEPPGPATPALPPGADVHVVQDRLAAAPRHRARLLEALEAAFHRGKGRAAACAVTRDGAPDPATRRPFSTTWTNPATGFALRPPSTALFNFNNPLGACPKCRGFGRLIGLDLDRAVPDPSLTLRQGAIRPFQGERGGECQRDLLLHCRERRIDVDTPWDQLPAEVREWIYYGDRTNPGAARLTDVELAEALWQAGKWYGLRGFFAWLESKAYKLHVRVFLARYRSYTACPACRGRRLQPEALCFKVHGRTLPELWQLPVTDLLEWFQESFARVPCPASRGGLAENGTRKTDTRRPDPLDPSLRLILTEITSRLTYLADVGLGYLTLDRPTRTLSGGEVERVNLTTCLGAALTSTLFVLDEPTVGLHPRDIHRLVGVLHGLRDKGNTLVVVEHDEAVIRAADHLLDLGPGAGERGGEIVYQGAPPPVSSVKCQVSSRRKARSTPSSLETSNLKLGTFPWLTGEQSIPAPARRRRPGGPVLTITGAARHNLRQLDVALPLGLFVCLTGVSGSGKSTLARDVIHHNLARRLGREPDEEPARIAALHGAERVADVLFVDQSPLARTPRSTPAVLLGAFDAIRRLFALTPDARARNLGPGHFSFNAGDGRCDRCGGNGFEKVEMQFLSDLYVTCPDCNGRRYKPSTLDIRYRDRSIADVLDLTVDQALAEFAAAGLPPAEAGPAAQVTAALAPLAAVGLGYLRLGQPLNTLSGGESQRLKLCQLLAEAGARGAPAAPGLTKLLILDEPTTGLHFSDIERLLAVFQQLVDAGHSLLVIEHNVEVIQAADWILDLGPDAGAAGGQLVGNGPPEHIATLATPTGVILANRLRPAPTRRAPSARPPRSAPAAANTISLRGAREHNLKGVSLDIPRERFVVVSGLSGSGKSTLAFDIIFAEGQRRFLDSMSAYARQFAEQLEKPDVDHLAGLPPTVAIEQRISQGGNKSTVATITEVWNFVRLLFARLGTRHCPDCGLPVEQQSLAAIEHALRARLAKGPVTLLAPLVRGRKGYHTEVAEWAARQGFDRLLVDGTLRSVDGFRRLERFREHDIDVVVGEVPSSKCQVSSKGKGRRRTRSTSSPLETSHLKLETLLPRALAIGKGTIRVLTPARRPELLSTTASCPRCRRSFDTLDPRLFSFNSPHGWCPACRGHGLVPRRAHALDTARFESVLDAELDADRALDRSGDEELVACPACRGARLNPEARAVRLAVSATPRPGRSLTIDELGRLPVDAAAALFAALRLPPGRAALIGRDLLPEIRQRLEFLQQVGLGYLQLDRSARTLSGGESQRIRLAAQLGSNLRGVLYVLDEPTIGLHPHDNSALLDTLAALRDKGNSLLVVEHDEATIRRADHLIDLGPGAGRLGGEVVYQGPVPGPVSSAKFQVSSKSRARSTPSSLETENLKLDTPSPTLRALRCPLAHPLRGSRRKLPPATAPDGWLVLSGCREHNLQQVDARIPLARLTVITGVSGSGKSSLMHGCLAVAAATGRARPATRPFAAAAGFQQVRHAYEVDQSPIGKTSRSCPATYVKVFDDIRRLYAQLPEARMRGFDHSRFSFNNHGGRCPECGGNGRIRLEMDFLPPSWVHCDACNGRRYNAPTLEVTYRDRSIADVLEMTIAEAAAFFEPHPRIAATLRLLADTGLGYLQLGQPSPTLSGGEAQRLKLVTELVRGRNPRTAIRIPRPAARNLYLIEEPTVGLHHDDVRRLLDVLHRLVDEGHTVVVIEHHMDVAAEADYLLDLGPGAGQLGGRIVACGTPEQVARAKSSRTAPFLRHALAPR